MLHSAPALSGQRTRVAGVGRCRRCDAARAPRRPHRAGRGVPGAAEGQPRGLRAPGRRGGLDPAHAHRRVRRTGAGGDAAFAVCCRASAVARTTVLLFHFWTPRGVFDFRGTRGSCSTAAASEISTHASFSTLHGRSSFAILGSRTTVPQQVRGAELRYNYRRICVARTNNT